MASSEVPELEISDQDEDLGPESARVVAIQRRTEMLMAARERSGLPGGTDGCHGRFVPCRVD